ncbi:MAG TPA: hypothetical protein VH349_15125 [Ktedonobacterales bacterium]|jgi:hypothetical protein
MFPIAHAWMIEQCVPSPTLAHYLGCVWPDMLYGSPLTHQQTHREGAALAAYATPLPPGDEAEEFRQFVQGALSHGVEPHGFDWYSDEEYGGLPASKRGYAFQRGRQLAERAAAACGVAPDQGWWKAHNLIEMAFERRLFAERTERGERIAAACADTALVEGISVCLAEHFGQPALLLAAPVAYFPQVVEMRPTTVESLARTYAMQTRLRHPGAEPDEAAIASLITKAETIVAPDADKFLRVSSSQVRAMLNSAFSA